MDYYGFAKPGTEFSKPCLEDYYEGDGYYDFSGYDQAVEQWRSQFPDFRESWCGERQDEPQLIDHNTDWLINLLAA